MTDLRTMQVYGFVFYFVLVCLLACFWFGFFSDKYGKMWDFRLEKQLNTKQSSVSHPSRSLEVISTGAYLTVEAQAKGLQRGAVLATGLETILVILQQRTWLLSALSLSTCLRLNEKVID